MQNYKRVRINKKELYNAILDSQSKGHLTTEAFKLLHQLCINFVSRVYYKDPKDRDDCTQTALLDCLIGWKKFNPEKSNNAFSYFTQVIKIGLIKGWKSLNPGKLNTISLDSNGFEDGGVYSI